MVADTEHTITCIASSTYLSVCGPGGFPSLMANAFTVNKVKFIQLFGMCGRHVRADLPQLPLPG